MFDMIDPWSVGVVVSFVVGLLGGGFLGFVWGMMFAVDDEEDKQV